MDPWDLGTTFNKKETYNKHMKEAHEKSKYTSKGGNLETVSNENQLNLTFPRKLRSYKKTDSASNLTFN